MLAQPDDLLTRRLVAVVADLLSMFDALDALDVEPKGPAKARAEGLISMFGPAAVMCALLQGSEVVREADETSDMLDLFAHTVAERKRAFLDDLPRPQRLAVERRARKEPAAPERVLQLFTEALAGMKRKDLLARWGSGGGIERIQEQVEKLKRGELDPEGLQAAAAAMAPGDPEAESPDEETDAGPVVPETLPSELLGVLGALFAGLGVDASAFGRVLSGVLPADAPEGYSDDGRGSLRRDVPKVGRNEPCPCGSGRKYKVCHGRR